MIHNKKVACIIPARLASTRLEKKLLRPIDGKPLIVLTYEAASKNPSFDFVILAVDHEQLGSVAQHYKASYVMTSQEHQNGTSRLIEVAQSRGFDADIWVNWQGDTPFVNQKMVNDFVEFCTQTPSDVWTLKCPLTDMNKVNCPNTVKVVCTPQNKALYFSRSPIPYYRDSSVANKKYYKHIGIYAYTSESLQKIAAMAPSPLEEAEYLEQLRFMENGLDIAVLETTYDTVGVDTHEDLVYAENFARELQL